MYSEISKFIRIFTELQSFLETSKLKIFLSSVAGARRYSSPHWRKQYAKYSVFNTFVADFCSKNKNNPPLALAMKVSQGPDVISTTKTGFQPG